VGQERSEEMNGRKLVFRILRGTGLVFLLRETIQRRRVTILLYHSITPELADLHLRVLKKRYSFLSLREYIDAAKNPDGGKLPAKALVLTLDDGHKSNYQLAAVFRKHGVMPTIFVCSGLIGTKRHFWFMEVSGEAIRECKELPDVDRLKRLRELGFEEDRAFRVRQVLSVEEMQGLAELVDFQSHTVSHPILPNCDRAKVGYEIMASKEELQDRMGSRVYALAYPNGDYSAREVELAKKAGYECALTVDPGSNGRKADLYRLKRMPAGDDADPSELLVRASGLWDWGKCLWNRGRGKKHPQWAQPNDSCAARPW
jgi:peptidoglycan/xylan/chitin deacetylase (PgdA/CDA1 family)